MLGSTVKNVITESTGRYAQCSPEGHDEFLSEIIKTDYKISDIDVKGKFMWWTFQSTHQTWYMWCTYGMSGQWTTHKTKHTAYSIEVISNNGVVLHFNDQRHFGTIKFVKDKFVHQKKLNSLGPDMLNDPPDQLEFCQRVLRKEHRTIAENLMDQSLISGVGNYIKSEALYRAKISPNRIVSEISSGEFISLRESVVNVMSESYLSKGASFRSYKNPDGTLGTKQFKFMIYDQKVAPCGHLVHVEETKDRRTSHWCVYCQK